MGEEIFSFVCSFVSKVDVFECIVVMWGCESRG